MASTPEAAGARPVPVWRQQLGRFWRWWAGEMARMVPERFASLGGASRVPQLAVEGDDVVLVEPKPAEGVQARVSVAQDAGRAQASLRTLLGRAGETRSRARVLLGPGEALVRRATMPAATEENLGQVLGFEMDRLTPFRAEEVYFDYRVIGRDAAAGTIQVLIALARRDLVDARVERLRALGLTVEGVNAREDALHGAAPLNLMPAEARGGREAPAERAAKRGLLGVVVVLLVVVLAYPPWSKREAIKALHPVEAKAQAEAQVVGRLSQELERLVGEYNFLLARKHGSPPMLAYIEEISRLLPDNTWVQQLDIKTAGKARELQIQGETASSSKLIEILEQSTLLQNAAPRGTVTRGSLPGTERFAIAAEAKTRPPPEPTAVLQLPTPVAPAARAAPGPAQPAPAPVAPTPAAPAKPEPPKAAPAKVEPVPPKAPADPKAAKPAGK